MCSIDKSCNRAHNARNITVRSIISSTYIKFFYSKSVKKNFSLESKKDWLIIIKISLKAFKKVE